MISFVFPIFIHRGALFCCRQLSSCLAILPVRDVKFLSQYPWTPSGPGAFQLDVLFNWTRMFCGVIEIDAWLSTSPSCSSSCNNQSTSLLCHLVSPHTLLQNVTRSLAPGAGSFPLTFPSSSSNKCLWSLSNRLFRQNCFTLFSYRFIVVAFAVTLCFNCSKTTWMPFSLVLHLCYSATWTLLLIGSLLKIQFSLLLMSFLSSSICFFTLCFHGRSFRAPFVLPFFTPNDLPATNAAALIRLLVSVMSFVVLNL